MLRKSTVFSYTTQNYASLIVLMRSNKNIKTDILSSIISRGVRCHRLIPSQNRTYGPRIRLMHSPLTFFKVTLFESYLPLCDRNLVSVPTVQAGQIHCKMRCSSSMAIYHILSQLLPIYSLSHKYFISKETNLTSTTAQAACVP